jgi:uncharacterized membrane protein
MTTATPTGSDPLWRTGWHGALFWWGLVIGLVPAAALNLILGRLGARVRDQPRYHHRRVIYTVMWTALGVELGVMAAAFDLAWLDIGVAAYVMMCALAAATLVLVKRRSLAR